MPLKAARRRDLPALAIVLAFVFSSINILPRDEPELLLIRPESKPRRDGISFKNVQFIEYVGSGTGKLGFKARVRGRNGLYGVKISGDENVRWTDIEAHVFQILNAPPTIPNIPQVELYLPSIKNPFKNQTHLENTLKVEQRDAKWLASKDTISIMVS